MPRHFVDLSQSPPPTVVPTFSSGFLNLWGWRGLGGQIVRSGAPNESSAVRTLHLALGGTR